MALTPAENFRFGFLLRCAEEGLSPDDVRGRVKYAQSIKEASGAGVAAALGIPQLGKALSSAANLFVGIPANLAMATVGGGAALGAAGGYGLAKMQNDDINPEEAKRQELIAAYRMHADRARRNASRRKYRAKKPREPALFTG